MVNPSLDEALQRQIASAARHLRAGGVAAIPTDTLYGLTACAFDENAVREIFRLKGRQEGEPLPLLCADERQAFECATEVSEAARRLAGRFWPGALTIVLKKADRVPGLVSGGKDTVGLRVPAHPVPRAIARALEAPIIGTSANISGQPGLKTADAVREQFGEQIEMIVDWTGAPSGTASTVVDLSGVVPRLLREGPVTWSDIEAALSGTSE